MLLKKGVKSYVAKLAQLSGGMIRGLMISCRFLAHFLVVSKNKCNVCDIIERLK